MSSKSITLGEVEIGDKLPELAIDITSSLIVGGALASNDYTPVHHDKGAAQASGMQDVFMNILTTNGLVGRFVTDWAGVDAAIKGVSIKLGSPNLPGDIMKLNGSITEKDEAEGTVVVQLAGKNSWGNHVEGSVKVALPAA